MSTHLKLILIAAPGTPAHFNSTVSGEAAMALIIFNLPSLAMSPRVSRQ